MDSSAAHFIKFQQPQINMPSFNKISCDSVQKPNSVVARAICLSLHPGKLLLFPFHAWFNHRYQYRYHFAKCFFVLDVVLTGVLATLLILTVVITQRAKPVSDFLFIDAEIAPREIISGASSTLNIRYTNTSNHTLKNVSIHIEPPKHFLTQELSSDVFETRKNQIEIADIPPSATGSVKLRGVMFGDVNGQQQFTARLQFRDDEGQYGSKSASYVFSPSRSTLQLELQLPNQLTAGQSIDGTIVYKNIGAIDFPEIRLDALWPEGFSLKTVSTTIKQNTFILPAIKAGSEGKVDFSGTITTTQNEILFVFDPAFFFGDVWYAQEQLREIVAITPIQLAIKHTLNNPFIRPDAVAEFFVSYTHTGSIPLKNLELGITSESPFFSTPTVIINKEIFPELAFVEPEDQHTFTIQVPIRSFIASHATDTHESIDVISTVFARYQMENGSSVTFYGKPLTRALVSPVILESFGRYASATGDQLGRGPLPPTPEHETKYWIFWHITATTNPLTSVELSGHLPENVTFTGRQTVSQNSPVVYDPETRLVSWNTDRVEPTFPPQSRTVAVGFEVALIPTAAQIGTSPTLVEDIQLTALDDRTGVMVSASGKNVTTDLPDDQMASGKGKVQP